MYVCMYGYGYGYGDGATTRVWSLGHTSPLGLGWPGDGAAETLSSARSPGRESRAAEPCFVESFGTNTLLKQDVLLWMMLFAINFAAFFGMTYLPGMRGWMSLLRLPRTPPGAAA